MIRDYEIRELYARLGVTGIATDVWVAELATGAAIRTKTPRPHLRSIYVGRFQRSAGARDINQADFITELRYCINLLEQGRS